MNICFYYSTNDLLHPPEVDESLNFFRVHPASRCKNGVAICPQPGGGFSYAKAGYESIHGKIESFWKKEDGKFTLNVTIPPNTTATVYVPAKSAGSVTEGGLPAGTSEGVRFLRMEADKTVYEVGSGHYVFVSEGIMVR